MALVITVIVLLILAGVAVSMITGEYGLFAKTNSTAIKYEKESLREKLDLAIRVSVLEKMNFSMTIEETIGALIEKGYTDKDKAVQINENQFIIQTTPEGYLVEITKKENDGYDIKVLDKGSIELEAFTVGVEINSGGVIVKDVTVTEESTEYEYYFSIDGGATWESNENKTISTYTYGTDKINNASSAKMRRITKDGKIQVAKATEFEYQYTGTYQPFIVPEDGAYQLEVWGASGYNGGKGGYAKGNKECTAGEKLYVYVGETGIGASGTTGGRATFNGGGNGGNGYGSYNGGFAVGGGSGGGATDIRIVEGIWNNAESLGSRIIVAGGGGGGSVGHGSAGAGGGETGGSGSTWAGTTAAGGSQTSGYAKGQGQAGRSKSGIYGDMGAEGNGGRRWRLLRRICASNYWIWINWRRRRRLWLYRRSDRWNNAKWGKSRKWICKNNFIRNLKIEQKGHD